MQRIRRRTVIVATGAALLPYVKPRLTALGAPVALMVSGFSPDGHEGPIHHVATQEADRLRPHLAGSQRASQRA
jgi:hypothetical protein